MNRLYSDSTSFSSNVIFLFQDPIQDTISQFVIHYFKFYLYKIDTYSWFKKSKGCIPLKTRKAIFPNVPHLKFLSPKGKQFYLSLPFILPPFNPVTLTSGLFLEHAKPTFILRASLYSNIFFPKNSTMTTMFKTVTPCTPNHSYFPFFFPFSYNTVVYYAHCLLSLSMRR